MKRPLRLDNRGLSLVEVLISLAITSVLVLIVGNVLMTTTKVTVNTDQRVKADMDLRTAMDKVETTLLNATEFQVARTTEVIFMADRVTDPNYQPYSDTDGDGIFNLYDPDDDNDATEIQPSSAQWRIGYDLKDEDDDDNSQIDMRWRLRFSTAQKILYRDYSRNGEAWGNHEETLLTNVVSTPIFTFYGSLNTLITISTITDINSDGLITYADIDAATNFGNNNFVIDGSTELARIVSIGVYLDKDDADTDANYDSHLSVEIMPPMLHLKRIP